MLSRFDMFMEHVFRNEGGYVNDPTDRGGETKYGITKLTARAYGYNGDMKQLTKEEARDIYLKGYYNTLYDKINSVSIAFKLFDLGINCGIATAVKRMQMVLQRTVPTEVGILAKVDGQFGPKTLQALNERIKVKGEKDVLSEYINIMDQYYNDIVKSKPSQKKFINGWLRRCHSRPQFEEVVNV